MQAHKIGLPGDEWLVARKAHLAEEKAFTRARDRAEPQAPRTALGESRQGLCLRRPERQGTRPTCSANRSQLIVYHFMLGPDWEEGCPSCSLLTISTVRRRTSRNAMWPSSSSRARRYRGSCPSAGWVALRWVSSFASDFNYDYQVSASPEEKATGR